MATVLREEIFNDNNQEFLKEYFELFINRLTHSNMSIEKDLGIVDSSENAIRLNDNMKAFKFLLEKLFNKEKMTEEIIKVVANMVNSSNFYISNDYRKMGNMITDTDIPISSPNNIKSDLDYVLDCYEKEWNKLDPYRKEALFHLYFIRIHPFEDGNGRTSRLLLNFNLLRQGVAPVIITEDLNDEYQRCIKDGDLESLTNIFKNQAIKENEVINALYSDYCQKKYENDDEINKIK